MPERKQLILNPNFARRGKGWSLVHATKASGKRNSVELAGSVKGDEPYSAIAAILNDVPTQHFLTFSCDLLKAEIDGNVIICIYAFNKNGEVVGFWRDCWHTFTEKWTTYNSNFVVPSDAKGLWLWVQNYEADSAFVRKPSMTVGKPAQTSRTTHSDASVILEANYHAAVSAKPGQSRGSVYFPIPGTYLDQVPISFEISANPKSALLDWKIYSREDGINWLCKADLAVGESVIINWKALVLVNGQKQKRTRKSQASPPKAISQWLRSTVAVQSKDVDIQKKARALVKGTDDIKEQASRIMRFCFEQPHPDELLSLDAKTALAVGGSCTSRANLGAALLRARGIPARTIAHLPVSSHWCDMHWLTEYWHPGHGWIGIETSLNKFAPPTNQRVVLSVASADDEDKSRDPIHSRVVLPGAPYLSISLVSPELTLGYGWRQNFAAQVAHITGTKLQIEEFQKVALRSFAQVTNATFQTAYAAIATDEIVAALQAGKAAKLTVALRKRNRKNH